MDNPPAKRESPLNAICPSGPDDRHQETNYILFNHREMFEHRLPRRRCVARDNCTDNRSVLTSGLAHASTATERDLMNALKERLQLENKLGQPFIP